MNLNLIMLSHNLPLSIGEADPLILPNTVESFLRLLFSVLSLSLFLFAFLRLLLLYAWFKCENVFTLRQACKHLR